MTPLASPPVEGTSVARRPHRTIVVDIADLHVSDDPDALLVTYALGSCVAVTAWDPVRRAGGMIHFMLPLSLTAPDKAKVRPAMFADTGVPLLFERLYALGSRKGDLVVKLAGGGQLYAQEEAFDIGRRNHAAARNYLWQHEIPIAADDVGGSATRTLRLHIGTGRVVVRSHGEESEL